MFNMVVRARALATTTRLRQIDLEKARSRALAWGKTQRVPVILGNRFFRFTFKVELIVTVRGFALTGHGEIFNLAHSHPEVPTICAVIRPSEGTCSGKLSRTHSEGYKMMLTCV
jgi:hypothetical protein